MQIFVIKRKLAINRDLPGKNTSKVYSRPFKAYSQYKYDITIVIPSDFINVTAGAKNLPKRLPPTINIITKYIVLYNKIPQKISSEVLLK